MSGPVRLRTDDVAWRRVGDEIVVLDLRSNMYLAANPSAAMLWDLLEEGCDPPVLAQRLADEYGLGADQAVADAEALVAGLAAEGLLEELH